MSLPDRPVSGPALPPAMADVCSRAEPTNNDTPPLDPYEEAWNQSKCFKNYVPNSKPYSQGGSPFHAAPRIVEGRYELGLEVDEQYLIDTGTTVETVMDSFMGRSLQMLGWQHVAPGQTVAEASTGPVGRYRRALGWQSRDTPENNINRMIATFRQIVAGRPGGNPDKPTDGDTEYAIAEIMKRYDASNGNSADTDATMEDCSGTFAQDHEESGAAPKGDLRNHCQHKPMRLKGNARERFLEGMKLLRTGAFGPC